MATPTKKIEIKLGDGTKKRFLRYDFASIEWLEEQTGEPLSVTMERGSKLSARALSFMVCAGLLHAEPDMTRERVAKMFPLHQLTEILTQTTRAILVSTGKDDPEKGQTDEGKGDAASDETS